MEKADKLPSYSQNINWYLPSMIFIPQSILFIIYYLVYGI